MSSYETPFKKESIIALIGPKRMNYEHSLAVLNRFRSMLAA